MGRLIIHVQGFCREAEVSQGGVGRRRGGVGVAARPCPPPPGSCSLKAALGEEPSVALRPRISGPWRLLQFMLFLRFESGTC